MEDLQKRLTIAVLGKELAEHVPLRIGAHWKRGLVSFTDDTCTTFLYIAAKDRVQHFQAEGHETRVELVDLTSNGQGTLTELEKWAFFKFATLLDLVEHPGDDEPKHLMLWSYQYFN